MDKGIHMWDRLKKGKESERLETEGEVREESYIIKKDTQNAKQGSEEGRERGLKVWVGWTRFTNFSNGSSFLAHCCSLFLKTLSPKPRPGSRTRSDRVISSVTQAETWHLLLGWNFFLFLQEQRRWGKLLENKQSSNRPNPPHVFFLAFFPRVSRSTFTWKW